LNVYVTQGEKRVGTPSMSMESTESFPLPRNSKNNTPTKGLLIRYEEKIGVFNYVKISKKL